MPGRFYMRECSIFFDVQEHMSLILIDSVTASYQEDSLLSLNLY